MMLRHKNIKIFLGSFLLLAYISMGIFGLLHVSHMGGMPMTNCPYTENNLTLCDNGLRHINNWRQFSNVPLSVNILTLSLLLTGVFLYVLSQLYLLNQKRQLYKWKHFSQDKNLYTPKNRIISWLSLFEHSPSLPLGRTFGFTESSYYSNY